jgi:ribonucleoside-diphosphate reductase subunit M2
MESPGKKLDFAAGKENKPFDVNVDALEAQIDADTPVKPMEKPVEDVPKKEEKNTHPDEVDEPLLQENPQRFVLFPIQYHEVCGARRVASSRVNRFATWADTTI